MTITFGYAAFTVADVDAALTFFSDAFGLTRRFMTPEGDYGELDTGATTLSFVRNDLAHVNLDQAGGFTELRADAPPLPASITLVTDDVADAVARALAAGGSVYVEAIDKPWGQTVAYVRAPQGILVEVATPVPT